ncbi:hypothetical protein Cgig2_003037 [Carnegiea gigantea]|uniref:Uncharacterized protein n=1 Tax=Carnegiea gigantea TaxID=171969 RepID=A0A9Q1K4K8_9CARY|nr:hypothetical protein Cgig2_003037 [Carnegiea gigantea]
MLKKLQPMGRSRKRRNVLKYYEFHERNTIEGDTLRASSMQRARLRYVVMTAKKGMPIQIPTMTFSEADNHAFINPHDDPLVIELKVFREKVKLRSLEVNLSTVDIPIGYSLHDDQRMICECYLVSIKPLVEQKGHLQVVFPNAKAKKPRLKSPNIAEALTICTIIMEDQ